MLHVVEALGFVSMWRIVIVYLYFVLLKFQDFVIVGIFLRFASEWQILFFYSTLLDSENNLLKYLNSIIWKKDYSVDEVPITVDLQSIIYMKP